MDSIFASNLCILEMFRKKHNPGAIILLLAIQFNLPISTDWDTSELTIVFGCPAIDLSSLISPFWGIPQICMVLVASNSGTARGLTGSWQVV